MFGQRADVFQKVFCQSRAFCGWSYTPFIERTRRLSQILIHIHIQRRYIESASRSALVVFVYDVQHVVVGVRGQGVPSPV